MATNSGTLEEGQKVTGDDLAELVSALAPGVVHAVGYGSGVFAQEEGSSSLLSLSSSSSSSPTQTPLPMVDLLLAVDDPVAFHRENMSRHPDHYSAVARSLLGEGGVAWLQRAGAGVYYNPLATLGGDSSGHGNGSNNHALKFKYGVVETTDLVRELTHWDHLYLAGRLQKPTLPVPGYVSPVVQRAQEESNLPAALAAALLLRRENSLGGGGGIEANEDTGTDELYERIAALSYLGDVRWAVGGEDPHKLRRLVHAPGQLDRFHRLYRVSMEELLLSSSSSLALDDDRNVDRWCRQLPPRFRSAAAAGRLGVALARTVAISSAGQTFKGLFTAGLGRSASIVVSKLRKGGWRIGKSS